MKYLIDTCVISEFRQIKPTIYVLDWFNSCDENLLYISSLSIGELYYGISRLPEGKKKSDLMTWFSQVVKAFFDRILPVADKTTIIWAEMCATAERQGLQFKVIDGLLAATAQEHDLCLVTRNTKDFVGTGIKIINPWLK